MVELIDDHDVEEVCRKLVGVELAKGLNRGEDVLALSRTVAINVELAKGGRP